MADSKAKPPPQRRPSMTRGCYFFSAAAFATPAFSYLRRKRSTRPAVSTSFCLPVKNGWQLEQISRLISLLWVERVVNTLPQAQWTRTSLYAGWMAAFMTPRNLSWLKAYFNGIWALLATLPNNHAATVQKLRMFPAASAPTSICQHL